MSGGFAQHFQHNKNPPLHFFQFFAEHLQLTLQFLLPLGRRHTQNDVVQRGAKSLPQLHKEVNRRDFLTLLQISNVSVTDVQVDGKLLLCHFTVFSEVLDDMYP